MKRMLLNPKKILLFLLASMCLFNLIGCSSEKPAEGSEAFHHGTETVNNEEIYWSEVSENGVDEDLLIRNIDEETLKYIAEQLQELCAEIDEKGEKDKNYWLTGQWYSDATDSKQYQNVVSIGKEAMKPLFLIIYKSENSGMYEWICSKALEEISGYDFSKENNGNGWSDSKEFLEMFIYMIEYH